MSDAPETVVVGGGQAGLSVSHELSAAGIPHVVLERGRVGQTWRGRWDSFCLVTPNWSVQLPGHPYDGDDPDGFMPRDEIVALPGALRGGLRRAGARGSRGHRAPRRTRRPPRCSTPRTARSRPRNVILSTGAYQRPHRPAGAASLPPELFQIDVEEYRNPDELPAGAVLVVGSGQSGLPDLRGAPRRRSRRVPRLRPRGLGTPADQRTGHRLVAGRVRQLRRPRRGPAGTRREAMGERPGDRARRGARPALPDPARGWA